MRTSAGCDQANYDYERQEEIVLQVAGSYIKVDSVPGIRNSRPNRLKRAVFSHRLGDHSGLQSKTKFCLF